MVDRRVHLAVEFDREEDGRWIAAVEAIPGCYVYGATREEALARVMALALHALADRLEQGQQVPGELHEITFDVAA